jgi:hypothetical protein
MAGKNTGRDGAIGCLMLVVIGLLMWGGCAVFSGTGSHTTYRAEVTGRTVINPADLAVSVRVTNTGKSAGTPECTLEASDPSGAYTGIDVATPKGTLAAGATVNFADNLTIKKQGARYVTDVKVTCK